MKLTLTKESVRKLAVKSAVRTGNAGIISPAHNLDTFLFCPTVVGTGGYNSAGAPGGCHPDFGFNQGDPVPVVKGGAGFGG